MRQLAHRRPWLTRVLLWVAAAALTLGAFAWQDTSGPTTPLEGEIATASGPVRFLFVRSGTVQVALPVVLIEPVPSGITGRVEYRRFKSNDHWSALPMHPGTFSFERRGRSSSAAGIGAALPGLPERAGKYEIFVRISDGEGGFVSVTGDRPVYARFKAEVPNWALVAHILAIFISMTFATRTVLEAAVDGEYRWMLWATIVSLLAGAFLLGPLVQWYAFGVWWSGIPFGYDWTDNKVLVSLFAWGLAAYVNRGGRRNRRAIYAAGIVTLLVYFIPHSIFGSEYDYRTGKGHGTAG